MAGSSSFVATLAGCLITQSYSAPVEKMNTDRVTPSPLPDTPPQTHFLSTEQILILTLVAFLFMSVFTGYSFYKLSSNASKKVYKQECVMKPIYRPVETPREK